MDIEVGAMTRSHIVAINGALLLASHGGHLEAVCFLLETGYSMDEKHQVQLCVCCHCVCGLLLSVVIVSSAGSPQKNCREWQW